MAVYKVIQDVEAEDKLLGPLTLKSFIYAGITAILAFISVRLLISGIGPIKYLFIIIFLPPMLLFGVLASPLGRDQPTEVWLLSRVRFMLKPRKRVWNQSGVSHPVTVTVPKKVELQLTKDLSQTEVRSRLAALANTIDSRGWAVKNANLPDENAPAIVNEARSDRLVKVDSAPKDKPTIEVHPRDDILDEKHNPTAKKFDKLIKEKEAKHKKGLMEMLKSAIIEPDKKHHDEPPDQEPVEKPEIHRIVSPHQHQVHKKKHHDKKAKTTAHNKPYQPKNPAADASSATPVHPPAKNTIDAPTTPVTPAPQAVNIKLAQSGSDLKVSTVAQMADHLTKVKQLGPNEVEIDLH